MNQLADCGPKTTQDQMPQALYWQNTHWLPVSVTGFSARPLVVGVVGHRKLIEMGLGMCLFDIVYRNS